MMRFNTFRAKDPVLAAILALGLVFSAPAVSKAQAYDHADWEEVGPAGQHAQQQLMSSPPRVVASPLGQTGYRPPVEPPTHVAGNGATPPGQDHYIVQAGDTLPKIAMKVYGDANRWQDLMVINNIENGNRIFVGQRLATTASNSSADAPRHAAAATNSPSTTDFQHEDEYQVPEHVINESPAPSVSADAAEADASFYGQTGGSYTIQRNDTLGKIAKRVLGSTQKWREIARANPSVNPNRLNVGETIVIPGAAPSNFAMTAPVVEARPLSSQPWQSAMAAPVHEAAALRSEPPTVSAPSFDPPPLMAPPPPPSTYQNHNSAPNAMDTYAPPPAPPAYSGGAMTAPPPPPPAHSSPPMYSSGEMTSPPPPPPYMSNPVPGPSAAPGMPVAIGTRELYREERYRIPDELKPTDFSPYFGNSHGFHGLFEVESALIPYIPTWNFGLHYRYEKYQYLNGDKNIIEGVEHMIPLHLSYAGRKFFAGLTVPFQNWEVNQSGGGQKVALSGVHDPTFKVGYQVWKNLEGNHAVTLHTEGKFPGGNYHQPLANMTGKSKVGVRVGPAEATRGGWFQVGGAYTGRLNEQWASHINLALANDPRDSITKFILRGGMDYRVNRNFAIVGELNSASYEMDNGPSDTNVDFLLGFILFNDSWQGSLGFPIALQKGWGYSHDFGVQFGLNHRWD